MKRLHAAITLFALTCTFARAAVTTLSFDDIVPGDGGALTTQYADRGVTFEQGIVLASPTARSGADVAIGVRQGELGTPYIRGSFTPPYASSVTAWVENNVAEPVYIVALDANGNRIKEVDAQRTAAPGTYFSLAVSSALPNIATFIVGGNPGGQNVVADDLAFDRADPNAGGPWTVQVDVAKDRHAIDPRIYGITWATSAQIADLNAPTNRHGGTPTSRYNWAENVDNRGNDYFFESIGYDSAVPGAFVDDFIGATKTGGGDSIITIPMIDWIAKVGPNRSTLSSYSINKYGPQTDHDPNTPDFGSGFAKDTKKPITNNDPNDANAPNSVDYQRQWLKHLVGKWGASQAGGVKYYGLDNEPGIWHSSHQDVQPVGVKQDDYLKKALDFAGMIKEEDPGAVVTGPEEWGWSGYLYSGYDQQYGAAHNFQSFPDRAAHGDMEYSAWLLDQFHRAEMNNGKRLLDVFTLHYYPQSGEFTSSGAEAIAPMMQQLRNESTRSLWDPNYLDKSWINDKVNLIPRMKSWVNTYYPGTLIGLTEYNWGAEDQINGATAQADVLGILGREGVDIANRWTTPDASTPTYKAMKLYRNYDGKKSTFGDVSVSAAGPNPDETAVFASQRSADGAVTVMVVNKVAKEMPETVHMSNFVAADRAQEWQLTAANTIDQKADVAVNDGTIAVTVPAQSITLFVVPTAGAPMGPPVVPPVPAVDPTFTSSAVVTPGTVAPGKEISIATTVTGVLGELQNAIVDVEVYNARGERVAQNTWMGQNFTPNHTETYAYALTAPAAEGAYTVEIGVFNADWSKNPHWNNQAATFTVQNDAMASAAKGDLNGDGVVDLKDVILLMRIGVGLDPATPGLILAGDLSGNGSIDIGDAVLLLRKVVGL